MPVYLAKRAHERFDLGRTILRNFSNIFVSRNREHQPPPFRTLSSAVVHG